MLTPTIFLLSLVTSTLSSPPKPHVIFIVADDFGWDDVSYRNPQIHTVNLAKYAKDGIILDNYYVQSVCSPTRAAIMTGRYPIHTTVIDWLRPQIPRGLPLNETTMADEFSSAGYTTHAIGKWHLGFHKWAYTPTFRGFDSFFGYYSGGEDYYTHKTQKYYDFRFDPSRECGAKCSQVSIPSYEHYSAQLFTSRAMNIIENHDPNKPLFMYLAYQSVHSPGEVPQYYEDMYKNSINNTQRRRYAGMVTVMDEGIGNVTRLLEKRGFMDDTILVFTSDNGGPTITGDGVGARNWPLRGGKHSIWEGGVRVNSFIWSRKYLSQQKGTMANNLMHGVDWMPTLLHAAGIQASSNVQSKWDGVNQWEVLLKKQNSARNRIFLGYDDDPIANAGIRIGDWKLLNSSGGNPSGWYPPANVTMIDGVEYDELMDRLNEYAISPLAHLNRAAPKYELYNVTKDPTEHNEVSGQHPDVVNTLAKELEKVMETAITPKNDNCPKPAHPTYPTVGGVWEPWC